MEEWPRHHEKNSGTDQDTGLLGSPCFYTELGSLLKALMTEAPMDPKMFARKKAKACNNTTLYGLAQCTRDLSNDNCGRCLGDAVAGIHTSCCDGEVGERFLFPSCIIRYEIYAFAFDSGTTWVPITKTDGKSSFHFLHFLCRCSSFFSSRYKMNRNRTMISWPLVHCMDKCFKAVNYRINKRRRR